MSTPIDINRRQREPIPYVGPWSDEPHKQKAAAGLCYRLVCQNVAHHGWRNTGMQGAKYCLSCVRSMNEGLSVPLLVPVETSPESEPQPV